MKSQIRNDLPTTLVELGRGEVMLHTISQARLHTCNIRNGSYVKEARKKQIVAEKLSWKWEEFSSPSFKRVSRSGLVFSYNITKIRTN